MNKRFLTALLTGAFFLASTSMFVACKDYDDDIKNLQAQIDKAALQTDLQTLKTSLESELSTLKASLATAQAELAQKANKADVDAALANKANKADVDAALAKKADKSELEALATKVASLTERVAAIETKISAIETALDKKADKTELATLEATLTGKLENLEKVLGENLSAEEAARKAADIALEAAYKAADANLQLQIDAANKAIEALQAKDTELQGLISANTDAINALTGRVKANEDAIVELKSDVAALKEQVKTFATKEELAKAVQELAEKIQKEQEEIDVLEALVIKQLSSLVLMPEFYWEGVEGIEIPFANPYLFAQSNETYSFTYTVTTGQTQGNNEIKVTVKNPMGFLTTDGKIRVIEKAVTWKPEGNDRANNNFSLRDVWDWRTVAQEGDKLAYTELSNGGFARYHVNPTTVDLTGATISFFENDAEVYTRGNNGLINPTPKDADAANDEVNVWKNGILTIPFTVDTEKVMGMFKLWASTSPRDYSGTNGGASYDPSWWQTYMQGYYSRYDYTQAHGAGLFDNDGNYDDTAAPLPFIAAQLTDANDRVVTSDYAVVVPAVYDIVALADNGAEEMINGVNTGFLKKHPVEGNYSRGAIAANHLYESVGYDGCTDQAGLGAIPRPATHSVVYNSTIDLKPFIETHYDYKSFAKYGKSTADQVMSDDLLEALGLSYNFTIVDYTTGNETTSQSAHIEQIEKGVFAPRSVTEDGKTITGKTATQEAIGREPLIRVDLVDKDGNIVRYGYIKLRIVADKAEDLEVTIPLGDVYMNCGDSAKVTWSQVENLILAKLNGGKGMTKQDFEKNYYLDVANRNINYMPYENPAETGQLKGTLYEDAQNNKFWARRYFKNDKGEYELAQLGTHNKDEWEGDDNLSQLNSYTATANWFGRVWYTPHDNSTTGHNWDENTNVLFWNLGTSGGSSNMTEAAYLKMRDAIVKATYESKGLNTVALSTVVRFINKVNGTSIYVTLSFDVNKIHFAYADINRRVLDHWYDYKTGYLENTADTIEVYANVPTPAEVGRAKLTTTSFQKDLKEYWLQKKVIPSIYDAAHFDKYWADGEFQGSVKFQFRLPKSGENTVDIDVNADGKTWNVDGISGNTYTLYLNDAKSEIWAKKNADAGMSAAELICKLDATTGVIEYMGRDQDADSKKTVGVVSDYTTAPAADKVNGAASDILNLIGMYDAQGTKQKDVYLTGHAKRTFAAYVEIVVDAENCIDPLIGKNYFNVRFLRPINVWAANYEITDAPNNTQFIDIWKLLYIRDWRTYAVVMDGKTQKFLDENKNRKGEFNDENKTVPYSFYNITNLYVLRDQIRSDAYLNADNRAVLSDPDQIKALYSIKDIPALTNDGLQYLKIIASADATENYTVAGTTPKTASTKSDDVLAYTNNGGVVKEFHIYVPIAVEYPWGALGYTAKKGPWTTQTAWAVITVKPTTGNE